MSTTEKKTPLFPGVQDSGTFTVAGMEFIKFPAVNGQVPAVAKNIPFRSRFGDNNDLRSSDVLRKMEAEILPKIIEAVGRENLCTIHTDLIALDGLKDYGTMESLISLPTMDFYRANVSIFDKHNPRSWWWLATPESMPPHYEPDWTLCVAPSGFIYNDICIGDDFGVRPFCIFDSSIFESLEG